MKYALDTNVHIAAFRDSTGKKAAEIQEFSAAHSTSIYLCSVVAPEFLVGIHPDDFKDVYREVVRPFEKTERVIYPSHPAYILAARAVSRENRAQTSKKDETVGTSFWNDALIAATCREHGVTLITRNTADFTRIRKVFAFTFAAPWPTKPPTRTRNQR